MQQNSIRVIIVDDHELVRQAWRMLLHNQNFISIIKECSSGVEAIQEATASDPHVMLMDINMNLLMVLKPQGKFYKTPHI